MLALVQAAGFVDAHLGAKSSGLGELLQLRVQLALSVGIARRPGCIRRAGIRADKDVVFECGQAVFLLKVGERRRQKLPRRLLPD
jgi:hypothetical protein